MQDTEIPLKSKSIIKSELIKQVAEKLRNTSPKDIETAIYHVLDCMEHTLRCGGRIEVRGFGVFSIRYRPARKARNPKTGGKVVALGKHMVHFKAGKEFKERINPVQEKWIQEEIQETCDMAA